MQFAGKLFTYLNYCPTKHFYVLSSITKSESAKNILLALKSMMKTLKNIYRLSKYRDIDTITKEKGFVEWRNDFKHYNETLKVLGHQDIY